MTDERMGDPLAAIARLPRGSGVVFRHYATPPAERRRLFEGARRIAHRGDLTLVLAASPRQASAWRADGVHGRSWRRTARPMLRTASAHDRRELIAAIRAGADAIFVSPVFPTRSHPGARALGPIRLGLLLPRMSCPAIIALGGMDAPRFTRLRALGLYGWAGIDTFT